MVYSVVHTPAGRRAPRPSVPLLETRRADLVMLCESRLRWAGIHFCTECLDRGESRAIATGSHRVCVSAESIEEARRLLAAMDDEIL